MGHFSPKKEVKAFFSVDQCFQSTMLRAFHPNITIRSFFFNRFFGNFFSDLHDVGHKTGQSRSLTPLLYRNKEGTHNNQNLFSNISQSHFGVDSKIKQLAARFQPVIASGFVQPYVSSGFLSSPIIAS